MLIINLLSIPTRQEYLETRFFALKIIFVPLLRLASALGEDWDLTEGLPIAELQNYSEMETGLKMMTHVYEMSLSGENEIN